MADDMWDWLVPNISGQTNAKVAQTRGQSVGANGRLDPNAITRETLSGYGIPSDVVDEASPYLGTHRMNADIAKSALTPPERSTGETIGGLLQALAVPVSFAQGNSRFGSQLFDDNIMTRDAAKKSKYQDAERDNLLKNAQNLTSNVDSVIADQQKNRMALKARKDAQLARENEADRYQLTGEARNKYILDGKYEPQFGATDDLKEYNAAKQQGYQGSVMDFLQMKKSAGGNPAAYKLNPDGSQSFVPGGPADPKTITEQALARGGKGTVPPAIRTQAEKADIAYNMLIPKLDQYAELVGGKLKPGTTDQYEGGTGWVAMPGANKDAVLQQRRDIQLQLKTMYDLGVLNGPDLMLMDSMLVDPTVNSYTDVTNTWDTGNRTRSSVSALKNKIREMRNAATAPIGMDEITADGQRIKRAPRTSIEAGGTDGTSVAPPVNDYSGLTDDEIKAQLGIE